MLHFSDSSITAGKDWPYKIRNVIDRLRSSFLAVFSLSQYLVIDESVKLFKGRLSFKPYILLKRNRFAVKTFVMYNCKNGYILDCIVYIGASSDVNVPGLEKSGSYCNTLANNVSPKRLQPFCGWLVLVQNYFCGFMTLVQNACRTVRKKRKEYA